MRDGQALLPVHLATKAVLPLEPASEREPPCVRIYVASGARICLMLIMEVHLILTFQIAESVAKPHGRPSDTFFLIRGSA